MTASKATFRGRRTGAGSSNIPRPIAQWFAGERRFTFYAFTYPWAPLLADYWRAWKASNPGAVPPPGMERLDKPIDIAAGLRHEHRVQSARKLGWEL